jgi:hypothetical protein
MYKYKRPSIHFPFNSTLPSGINFSSSSNTLLKKQKKTFIFIRTGGHRCNKNELTQFAI